MKKYLFRLKIMYNANMKIGISIWAIFFKNNMYMEKRSKGFFEN